MEIVLNKRTRNRLKMTNRKSSKDVGETYNEAKFRKKSKCKDLLKHTGTWVGNDMDEVLETINLTRSKVKW